LLKRVWNKIRSLNLRDLLARDDDDLLVRLEERLITADFGMEATARIMGAVTSRSSRGGNGVREALLTEVRSILDRDGIDISLHDPSRVDGPSVILLVGRRRGAVGRVGETAGL
jgi:signal recognition particle GTPase